MSEQDWIFGINAIGDLMRSDADQVQLLMLDLSRDDARMRELEQLAQQAGITVQRTRKADLEKQFPGMRHQGVAAQCNPIETWSDNQLFSALKDIEQPLLLMLDHVQDPRNLGACLRSAAAAGVDAVIVPKDRSASLTAVARNTASGAATRVPLVTVTNLARTLATLQKAGVWAVAADGAAKPTLYQVDLKGPLLIIMGSEDKGVQRLLLERSDFQAHIPMHNDMDSLNVSVATAVFLFEALRQRGLS